MTWFRRIMLALILIGWAAIAAHASASFHFSDKDKTCRTICRTTPNGTTICRTECS